MYYKMILLSIFLVCSCNPSRKGAEASSPVAFTETGLLGLEGVWTSSCVNVSNEELSLSLSTRQEFVYSGSSASLIVFTSLGSSCDENLWRTDSYNFALDVVSLGAEGFDSLMNMVFIDSYTTFHSTAGALIANENKFFSKEDWVRSEEVETTGLEELAGVSPALSSGDLLSMTFNLSASNDGYISLELDGGGSVTSDELSLAREFVYIGSVD